MFVVLICSILCMSGCKINQFDMERGGETYNYRGQIFILGVERQFSGRKAALPPVFHAVTAGRGPWKQAGRKRAEITSRVLVGGRGQREKRRAWGCGILSCSMPKGCWMGHGGKGRGSSDIIVRNGAGRASPSSSTNEPVIQCL